jgi:glycosyltransferase involved in cell wall biosynthesis
MSGALNDRTVDYDTHEFAVEEYAESRKWRLFRRPFVRAIERKFIGQAAVVSTVSPGIARRLDTLYRLQGATLVIRNTPPYEEVPFRETRDHIRVLYHGAVIANRGIEATIDSIPLWRREISLTIRGPENRELGQDLRRRVAALGVEDRVHLVPALPMTDLVREAAAYDIGFFALPGHSQHNQFALPNKLFEYIMACLAICVSDLPEMASLVLQYDCGTTIATIEAGAIAAAVNSLTPDRIDRFKRNALSAARELCWEQESKPLLNAYGEALKRASGSHHNDLIRAGKPVDQHFRK